MIRIARLYMMLSFVLITISAKSQICPAYGPEIEVTITGLSFDAMEPIISPDGNYLFFNNLNDGINTKLFYATRINDSTFNYMGELSGTNQPAPPHLDAVADMDSLNNFYWTSTRDYPAQLDNLYHGIFNSGHVSGIGRVRGDFNKNIPGWLIMDHGISYDGQYLYYNNARFDGVCQGACETELGVAQKVNDSTFNKHPNSDYLLQHVNDTNYIYYAPCITSDNLELYFTRYPKAEITPSTLFEICVSVRSSTSDSFSTPAVLFSEYIADLIEAPTLTQDKQAIYYHRKIPGSHKIVMRYRDNLLSIENTEGNYPACRVYPNPAAERITIQWDSPMDSHITLDIISLTGQILLHEVHEVFMNENQLEIDLPLVEEGAPALLVRISGHGFDTITKKILLLHNILP